MLEILKVSESGLQAHSQGMQRMQEEAEARKEESRDRSYSTILPSGDAVTVETDKKSGIVNLYKTDAKTGVIQQWMVTRTEDAYIEHRGELSTVSICEDPGVTSSGVNFCEMTVKGEVYSMLEDVKTLPDYSSDKRDLLDIATYASQISTSGKGIWQEACDRASTWWNSW